MRRVENVEHLQNPEADKHVDQEYAEYVRTPDYQDAQSQFPKAEEKCDREYQDRKSAGIDAVYERRDGDQRQQPFALIRQLPECRRSHISELEEKHGSKKQYAESD
jgi:hypothetical protein